MPPCERVHKRTRAISCLNVVFYIQLDVVHTRELLLKVGKRVK